MAPSSSPFCSSQPGEIAKVEREADRRRLDELNTQVGELKKVNKIWKKECETLKEKVNEKKRQGTLAKNEAFDLTKRAHHLDSSLPPPCSRQRSLTSLPPSFLPSSKSLAAISTRLGFDSTPSFLDFLRTSPQPPPLKETSARIASLESQLADSTSSHAALQTELNAETIAKDALASRLEAQKTIVEGLQKKLEREKHQADGLAFLLREKDNWREREAKMEEEALALRQELAMAKADAAGLRKDLEIRERGVASSSKVQHQPAPPSSFSRPPSSPSKHADVARLEALLESSRAEYSLLYNKNKKQKAAWKEYAESYPVAFDTVRAKEQKRAKKRESRGDSSKRDASEVGERSSKRIKIDSPVKQEVSSSSRDVEMAAVEEGGIDSPRRKNPTSSASVGRVVEQPSSNSPTSNRPSPASSPARKRLSNRRSPSVSHQSRSSSLVPTVVDSSPPVRSNLPSSSPRRHLASSSNAKDSAPLTPIQPSNLPRAFEDPSTRKKERRPHPLGQQAFGPSDLVQPSSSSTSSPSTAQPNTILDESTTPRPFNPQPQPSAGPSRANAFDSPSSHQSSPRPAAALTNDATPARPLVRQQALNRGSHTTPITSAAAERDRQSATRPWLGKKTVVNGKALRIDPLDMEVPEGEPFEVHRHTPRTVDRPPKSSRSEPRDAGSSSKQVSSTDAHPRVRSHGDAPLPPGPPHFVKLEPDEDADLFTIEIPNPKIPRVLYDSDDERNARREDPFYRSPESEEADEARRRGLKDPTAGMTPDQKSIFLKKQRNVPVSETRKLYAQFKGRGRYNQDIDVGAPGSSTKKKTINDEYQIDKSKNDGRDYAFNSVVRGKEQRKQLHGRDCECCRGYYEAVGPLAPLPQGPRWKSAPPESSEDEAADDEEEDENGAGPSNRPRRRRRVETKEERGKRKRDEEIQKHRQEISRHRDEWAGPSTPPFYWDIGFPDTQKVALINEAAERIEEEKRARIEAEANKGNGRYLRRE